MSSKHGEQFDVIETNWTETDLSFIESATTDRTTSQEQKAEVEPNSKSQNLTNQSLNSPPEYLMFKKYENADLLNRRKVQTIICRN